MSETKTGSALRIITAIAAKDITDAVKNRTVLSIILGTLVLMLSSMALPLLVKLRSKPTAIVYDPGRTTLIRALTTREEFQLGFVNSREAMAEAVAAAPDVQLGLMIPEDFGQVAGTAVTTTLDGYVAHWAGEEDVAALVSFFETQLEEASWRPIEIDVTGNTAYPSPESFGLPAMAITTIATALLTMGLAMVPNLVLEEKEHRTLDALLVSPARYGQVITGKAAAGLLYALVAAGIAFLLSAKWFAHPWLALATIALGALFAVAVGLLAGILVTNPESINAWMGLALGLLLVPVFIVSTITQESSPTLYTILTWIPSTTLSRLLAVATGREIIPAPLLADAARLGISTTLVTALIIWRVRQADR
jgi:ABC-2 type transport system permease protein